MKAIIVEDSNLARLELNHLLKKHKEIEIVGEAETGEEAIQLIGELNPELIFLDIHLPDMDGFRILNSLNQIPNIIFTTAYDQYAIKSFDYSTIDYLLKPITQQRLDVALQKLNHDVEEAPQLGMDNSIFIKDSDDCYLAKLSKISLFETEGNYTKVFFDDKSPLLHKSLNQIESRLDPSFFFRVNRQQLINVNQIKDIDTWFKGKLKLTLSCGNEVEVSERQSVAFKRLLSI
ncbi:LytTR family transcriptional regulator DNA-binding domain-containing protein [Flammeovirga yaeyamensis]|uniref:LytTR family transcriptional regulator DNA-binding domain-containing protein n=1 Tax=Flammeovirga yaeyamensis TaxID=367791 RepID=A0AAX1N2H3_9BACT|nr:LytTR family DNA-binding domain-containing protein [Flammeovirga yaeyamensis]MBB3701169.1 two-component system LytT family response regulator [Flammeovirga yaeyamensis]NMF38364.1 response regulator transcription factor [Flammeovirga yaeyamensis]QWG01635.1 LytTR family transcriptional regulator DNA-binding domain-containing protein [Flammeovirga yaeyamensis]